MTWPAVLLLVAVAACSAGIVAPEVVMPPDPVVVTNGSLCASDKRVTVCKLRMSTRGHHIASMGAGISIKGTGRFKRHPVIPFHREGRVEDSCLTFVHGDTRPVTESISHVKYMTEGTKFEAVWFFDVRHDDAHDALIMQVAFYGGPGVVASGKVFMYTTSLLHYVSQMECKSQSSETEVPPEETAPPTTVDHEKLAREKAAAEEKKKEEEREREKMSMRAKEREKEKERERVREKEKELLEAKEAPAGGRDRGIDKEFAKEKEGEQKRDRSISVEKSSERKRSEMDELHERKKQELLSAKAKRKEEEKRRAATEGSQREEVEEEREVLPVAASGGKTAMWQVAAVGAVLMAMFGLFALYRRLARSVKKDY